MCREDRYAQLPLPESTNEKIDYGQWQSGSAVENLRRWRRALCVVSGREPSSFSSAIMMLQILKFVESPRAFAYLSSISGSTVGATREEFLRRPADES